MWVYNSIIGKQIVYRKAKVIMQNCIYIGSSTFSLYIVLKFLYFVPEHQWNRATKYCWLRTQAKQKRNPLNFTGHFWCLKKNLTTTEQSEREGGGNQTKNLLRNTTIQSPQEKPSSGKCFDAVKYCVQIWGLWFKRLLETVLWKATTMIENKASLLQRKAERLRPFSLAKRRGSESGSYQYC